MLREEFLEPLNMTQRELADRIGVSYVRLNEIVNGRRGITSDTALRLERFFGVSAGFWLNLQQQWELWQTLHSDAAKEIEKIEPWRDLTRV